MDGQRYILKCDVAGQPVRWLHPHAAIVLYAKERVVWEAGETRFLFKGGVSRCTGRRSVLLVNSIIAARGTGTGTGTVGRQRTTPAVTRLGVFSRDGFMCMYCGRSGTARSLTLDHIRPVSRRGRFTWTNLTAACPHCNSRKGAREPHEAGMELLAVPFEPNMAEYLALSGRHVIGDQMAYLRALFSKDSPLNQRYPL